MADQSQISYYREIVKKENISESWREITINTGISTTQKDVQCPDLAGGYSFKHSGHLSSCARNRFICWRTSGNVIELSEVSLDFNLHGCHLRIRFSDAPVICGISFFETKSHLVILACTTSTAHRLLFQHPNTSNAQEVFQLGPDASLPSIFANVSSQHFEKPSNLHNINVGGTHTVYVAHTGAMHITNDGEAMFAMAVQNGGILVVKLPPSGSQAAAVQHEMKQSGGMSRFLGGFMQSIIRGQDNNNLMTSVAFHENINNVMIFAVGKDSKLRIWSALTYEFLGAVDLLEHVPDLVDQSSKVLGGTGHLIKMSACTFDQSMYMAVFLSFANKSQFVIYHLVSESKKYLPIHVATLFGIEGSLVDFYVTPSHLWTLWTLRTGESAVRYAVIDGHKRREWLDVLLWNEERLELDVSQPFDPREIYMDYIFHPGRFSTAIILKALKIYRRSADASHAETSSSIPISILKSEVCQAVEAETRLAVGDDELGEEEFVQLQLQYWSKFYSCCVQYHERGMKPVGIFSDEVNGMIGIIKKTGMSFLYPCPSLDQMYLGGIVPNDYEFLRDHPGQDSGTMDFGDLALLGRCLKVIRETIDEETAVDFENGINNGSNPVDLAMTSVRALQTVAREDTLRELRMELQKSRDVFGSIETLVELLDISGVRYNGSADESMDDEMYVGLNHVFASSTGIAILSEVFRQTMLTRFEMCRDLLVLVKLSPQIIDQGRLSEFGIKLGDAIFRLGYLVRSYNLLRWCSESVALQEATSSLESSRKQLETLNLLRPSSYAVSKRIGDGQQLTLLEAFISEDGGAQVQRQLMSIIPLDQESCPFWKQVLLPVVVMTARMIWPTVPGFLFPQSLIALGQHLAIQGYVRLLQDWCDIDTSSRRFLLGQSFLSCNEPYKALDCFLAAAQDVMAEEFLISFMSKLSSDANHIEVLYYLQVINLFEEFDFPHIVVHLAELAITVAAPDDPNLPTLWSKVFKNELEMGHNIEAYRALMGNPDTARGKDCLRQFLVVLCERNELSTLVDLPYRDTRNILEPEVVRILESRAKSVELKQNYYDLLYAFHVRRNNYRQAGSVMYEFGMRMRREVRGLKGLQKQARCYLACMNVLKLGNPKFAWILKPIVDPTNEVNSIESDATATGSSPPKRARKEEELQRLLQLKRHRVEVLGLDDIRKEYVLVHAHLNLLQRNPQASQLARSSLRPDETVGLLANAGMFDLAIEVCQIFSLPMTSVFEGLLLKCIWLSRGGTSQGTIFENQYTSDAWSWLQFNDTLPGTKSQEVGGAADCAWRLLELFLEKYEEKSARYHKCVAAKAFQQGFDLPSWFLASYKKINAPELLRLYISYGFLEESTELAIEYILATMGRGKEYFGLDDYLHAGSSPVWLPFASLDHLLHALNAKGRDKHYAELHHQLTTTLERYFSVVQKATEDTLVMLREH